MKQDAIVVRKAKLEGLETKLAEAVEMHDYKAAELLYVQLERVKSSRIYVKKEDSSWWSCCCGEEIDEDEVAHAHEAQTMSDEMLQDQKDVDVFSTQAERGLSSDIMKVEKTPPIFPRSA